jgi:hypothetical protein
MALADGYYLAVANAVADTLSADTASDGLNSATNPPVKLITTELKSEPKKYERHQLPALLVTVDRKREQKAGKLTALAFKGEIIVYCRGLTPAEESARVKKIVARTEAILRQQNDPVRYFRGTGDTPLTGLIGDSCGQLRCVLETSEILGGSGLTGAQSYHVVGLIGFTLEIDILA